MSITYFDYNKLGEKDFIDSGCYSNVYLLANKNKVVKIFNSSNSELMLKNIEKKTKILAKNEDLSDICVLPQQLVLCDNKIKGIIMEYFDGYQLWHLKNIHKIEVLNMIKSILLKFEEREIRYFDLHLGNILYKKEHHCNINIKFIDMDNVAIGNLGVEHNGYRLDEYLNMGGKADFNAEIYLFNWLSYVVLTNSSYDKSINKYKLKDTLEANNLYDDGIHKFCSSMFNKRADQIADHEFLIDYVNTLEKK